jgi:hypothetical protein
MSAAVGLREKVRERLAAAHNIKGDTMSHKVYREMKIDIPLCFCQKLLK